MKSKWQVGTMILALVTPFVFAGCGQGQTTTGATQTPSQTQTATTTVQQSTAVQEQNVYLVVEPGMKLGPDGKRHDAFIGGDFTVQVGKPVKLHIMNYDDGGHSLTAVDLNLNVQIKGATKKGEPAETVATFTPTKEGTFNWQCVVPCDGDNNSYAMGAQGYMQGKITVNHDNVQHVSMVINPDYKLGTDGKMHDAYTPGDITVNAGQPVELTIYNFGKQNHDFVSKQLGIEIKETGSKGDGNPVVFKTTFTPEKTGKYQWNCVVACDGSNGGYSMANDNYMTGFITVQ